MNNPQAFPTTYKVNNDVHVVEGMTLLDWFAGQALIGVLSNGDALETIINEARRKGMGSSDAISTGSYELAQAMLEERLKYIKENNK